VPQKELPSMNEREKFWVQVSISSICLSHEKLHFFCTKCYPKTKSGDFRTKI
jgi:hypothetical protein